MRLTDFKVLTFDCYGTLIDWESGIVAALEPLTRRIGRPVTRDEILEAHARHESEQQRATPAKLYRDVLAVVHKRLAEEWGVPVTWEECLAYGASVQDWPAFPDTAEALAYLSRHYRLVILSNIDNRSFETSRAKLGAPLDAVFTAEDIGGYKPDPANFEYMLGKLGRRATPKRDILHVAESLFHDHGPANTFGLASAWIHRRHETGGFGATMNPGAQPHIDLRFTSMAAFADAHRMEAAGRPQRA